MENKIKNELINKVENKVILKDQRGQTLVEFVLVLLSILIVSMVFMKIVNGNVAKYWTAMANTLLIDVEGNQKLKLR
jgi:Flp pilus assembly pilin Flp